MRISSAWDGVSSLGNANCGRYYVANLFIVDAHHNALAMGASFDFSTIDQVEVWNPNSLWAFNNGTGVLINVRPHSTTGDSLHFVDENYLVLDLLRCDIRAWMECALAISQCFVPQ